MDGSRRNPEAPTNGPDVDGHEWHSAEYVARWIAPYDESPGDTGMLGHLLDTVRSSAPDSTRRLLELGSGWGRTTRCLLDAFPGAHVTAVDFSEPMQREARRRLAADAARVRFVRHDLAEPGVGADATLHFDVVVNYRTLHHLPSLRLASLYREIRERLAPGGVFVSLDRAVVRRHGWREGRGAGVPHGASLEEHERMLEEAGFLWRTEPLDSLSLIVAHAAPS